MEPRAHAVCRRRWGQVFDGSPQRSDNHGGNFEPSSHKRKLAAILHADVVGFFDAQTFSELFGTRAAREHMSEGLRKAGLR
jgi:hypothetical protein